MKRVFIFLAPLTVFIIGALFGLSWWNDSSRAPSQDFAPRDFLVVKGRSAVQIGQDLYQEGLIKNKLAFKLYVQMTGQANKIQTGQFRLSPNFSLTKVVGTLTKPPLEVWLTVPEGLRREEVVEKVIKSLEIENQTSFRKEFLSASGGQEGYLFPDTYLFAWDASASTVVKKMTATFDAKFRQFESLLLNDRSVGGLDKKGIVILASIIERETKTGAERPIVAGILYNRLEIGMALQADAAVQYAVADVNCQKQTGICKNWWPILTKDDLAISSPYNTYKFRGLPPAPIANPGLSSLKAALTPQKTDYLYYIHDPTGQIHYAETLAEHNQNIRLFLGK